jgi:hypothetical protein
MTQQSERQTSEATPILLVQDPHGMPNWCKETLLILLS